MSKKIEDIRKEELLNSLKYHLDQVQRINRLLNDTNKTAQDALAENLTNREKFIFLCCSPYRLKLEAFMELGYENAKRVINSCKQEISEIAKHRDQDILEACKKVDGGLSDVKEELDSLTIYPKGI